MSTTGEFLEAAEFYSGQARNAMRDARQLVRAASYLRDEMIRASYRQGASLRDIAAVVGLSHTAVAKIVKRGT
jgi:transposase-like protein